MAGINATLRVQGKPAIVLRRDQAYIGVLIDDLVTKGTAEPYRMFTSRAEYRLILRQDNADLRLSHLGHDVGLLPERNYRSVLEKKRAIETELSRLQALRTGHQTFAQLLRRPEVRYRDLPISQPHLSETVVQQIEIASKYDGYIRRQEAEIEKFKGLEEKQIPEWVNYSAVHSLRTEARQKLNRVRPATIGQASRISGVSPSDISALIVWMKRGSESSRGRT